MHLFFTGEKRIGKTTLVEKILDDFPGKVGGFRTVRLNTWLPGRYTVHLFRPNEVQVPSWENFLFRCGDKSSDTVARFEKLGCGALEQCQDADLMLMDELGPYEMKAAAFQQAVWSVLEEDIPVLGVLQKADAPFLQQIGAYSKVVLIEVTKENREELSMHIPELIDILKKR